MRVRVLGAAAGGGFPQWNCGCSNCVEARVRPARALPRTQDSVAISSDGVAWFLINASPQILEQVESFPPLQPKSPRDSGIQGIILTNGDLDHCLGLLSLRESYPLAVYATHKVWRGLVERNAFFRTLQRFEGQVTFHPLTLNARTPLRLSNGHETGLSLTARSIPGKLPLHLEGIEDESEEDNIGIWLQDDKHTLAYVSAAGMLGDYREHLRGVDCLLFDGTFWSSDELIKLGLGTARAEDMAHLPVGGEAGSLQSLNGIGVRRKIYTHINNSNPMILEDSVQRHEVEEGGWVVAFDGMDIQL